MLVRFTGRFVIVAFKLINIDMAGDFKVPGIDVVGLIDQFDRFIGEKVRKLFTDPVNQCTQGAAGVSGFAGGPKYIDQCLGGDVVSFVGKKVGDQKKIG